MNKGPMHTLAFEGVRLSESDWNAVQMEAQAMEVEPAEVVAEALVLYVALRKVGWAPVESL